MHLTRGGYGRWGIVAGGVVALAMLFRLMTRETYDLLGAAQRAESYLSSRGTELDPAMLLILDYLDRRFGLPWVRSAITRLRAQRAACAEQDEAAPAACQESHRMGGFIRLIDPTARLPPEQIAALPNTLDIFTTTALYCQANGLPTTFPDDVERRLQQ